MTVRILIRQTNINTNGHVHVESYVASWNPYLKRLEANAEYKKYQSIQEVSIDSRSITRFTLVEGNLRDYWYKPTRAHQQEHH